MLMSQFTTILFSRRDDNLWQLDLSKNCLVLLEDERDNFLEIIITESVWKCPYSHCDDVNISTTHEVILRSLESVKQIREEESASKHFNSIP